MIRKFFSVLVATFFASGVATAAPITVDAGESSILVFDASALMPYSAVAISYSLASAGGATYTMNFFTNSDGTGAAVGNAAGAAGGSGGFNLMNNTGVFDGDFSAVVSAFGSPVTFTITATIGAAVIEPTVLSQVPEPATLTLLGLGMLGIAALRKRR